MVAFDRLIVFEEKVGATLQACVGVADGQPFVSVPVWPMTLAGSKSVKLTWVRVAKLSELGLVTVRVRVELPFTAIGFGANPFVIAGGHTSVTMAWPEAPLPPFEDVMVALFVSVAQIGLAGVDEPMTGTVTVQLVPIATTASCKRTRWVPGIAVRVAPPSQVVEAAGEAGIFRPGGKESVMVTPVRSSVFPAGLVMV